MTVTDGEGEREGPSKGRNSVRNPTAVQGSQVKSNAVASSEPSPQKKKKEIQKAKAKKRKPKPKPKTKPKSLVAKAKQSKKQGRDY